jgi:hypothetical protein
MSSFENLGNAETNFLYLENSEDAKKTQTTKIATSVCTFYKKPEDCEGENLAIASTTTSGYCEMGEPENVKTMNP